MVQAISKEQIFVTNIEQFMTKADSPGSPVHSAAEPHVWLDSQIDQNLLFRC